MQHQQHYQYLAQVQPQTSANQLSSIMYDNHVPLQQHIQYAGNPAYFPSQSSQSLQQPPASCSASSTSIVHNSSPPSDVCLKSGENQQIEISNQKQHPKEPSPKTSNKPKGGDVSKQQQLIESKQASSNSSSGRKSDVSLIQNEVASCPTMPMTEMSSKDHEYPGSCYNIPPASVIHQAHSLNNNNMYPASVSSAASPWPSNLSRPPNSNEFTYSGSIQGYDSFKGAALQQTPIQPADGSMLSSGNFQSDVSCIQPPVLQQNEYQHIYFDPNLGGNPYPISQSWSTYNSFSTEQPTYETVGSGRENCYPYVGDTTSSMGIPLLPTQQTASNLHQFPAGTDANHLAFHGNYCNFSTENPQMASGFAHLDSRDVHQDFYGHDVLAQSNQPQFTQLDPSQTISYAISETDHSGMYSGGIVPAILPQIASGDNNCTSSLIAPGTGVIKHIHQAPLMLPTTDSLFDLEVESTKESAIPNGLRAASSTIAALSTGTTNRSRKTPKLKSSSGGISRLVTDRESLKLPQRHHSPGVSSSDGNGMSVKSRKSQSRSITGDSDDDKSMDDKEVERRNANNTRERIRVRDINSAFKELAKLCCQHMPDLDERNLTKLSTLMKAVELIPILENKVRHRNLDPKSCLSMKRPLVCPPSGPSSSFIESEVAQSNPDSGY